ncbi:uncharacterized protein BO66DRAFT_379691 [Aspergillus aculeatinus CBS 121060]|uniref:Uncharacterized protein n=2 Tax=Aspergillus subgen. Circumdati TaxID=2720871 RepID=A0ACD1H155_9EURO|nr:hypothetical protein BO95DRAFT_420595 [Aspergillus brunneoviolaceus CBS 621.78]XP_025500951.1 hypothetical protein BO66DRAFT_379691 [Aspergillus aculeatinus CBS 121060]RAH42389.1 hypothetical protein BO95DRAFT_420595 [Aspergillus brunneoviolaceus CBS 621.78]RAH67128.1 hypothetical protein BO66DRAFT_379691 [Aspergillus aculeatinus CBS 121060]
MHNPDGSALEKGIWVAVGIATVILILRVVAKIKIRQLYVDDALMFISWALALSSTVLLTLSVREGFGSDLTLLPTKNVEHILKYIALEVLLVTISTGIARCSFVIYLLGILGGNKKYQLALWVAMLLQLAANIVSAVLPMSICRDDRILWNANIKTTCGNTVAVVRFSYFSSSVNTATDLFLAVFPTIVFWNLNLRLRIKISLIVLLSLGLVAMIASIIKTTKLKDVPSVTNIGASGGVELIRWGFAESLIIIITSSVPCVRPLLISSVQKLSSAARSRSYELSGPYSKGKESAPGGHYYERQASGQRDDADSIEQILKDLHRPPSGSDRRRDEEGGVVVEGGIQKQVEFSVVTARDES